MKPSHETRHFLFKWSGTLMYHHKTPGAESLSHNQVLLILLDIVLISVDTIIINTLLNKYSHMGSMEENDFTCNKLLGVIYVLLYCSLQVVPGPQKGFETAAGIQLAHSLLGHGTVCDAAWCCMKALISHHEYVGMRDPGSLTDLLSGSTANLISRKAYRVAFKRQFRQNVQCFKTDAEHWTRSGKSSPPYSDSRENLLLACNAGLYSLHQAILRWSISGGMDVMADALSR